MALRTIKGSAESKKQPVFAHFDKPTPETKKPDSINVNINDIMEKMGLPQFTYDSFKAAYDADPQIQEIVDNFSSEGIEINAEEKDDGVVDKDTDSNAVSKMAKAATDLSDNIG